MPTLDRSGVALFYTESGAGDPPMVFVHGWTCDHSAFSPQLGHFGREHRVVGVDLRGHGASDVTDGEYSMAVLADDVAFLCQAIGARDAVVVGHSMGAVVGVQLAASHPELASALVLVDPATIGPGNEGASAFADRLAGPEGPELRRRFIETGLFLDTDDPGLKARVVEEMMRADGRVAAACMHGLGAWDGASALAAVTVPTLVIHAERPMNDPGALAALSPGLRNVQTPGFGHFNQLLAPAEVNRLIDQFLAEAGTPAR